MKVFELIMKVLELALAILLFISCLACAIWHIVVKSPIFVIVFLFIMAIMSGYVVFCTIKGR